jgi:parallel beta-helix repeat protein
MATKRILVSLIIFLFTINIFTNLEIYDIAKAKKVHVGGSGDGNYSTIQLAIDISSIGDIVYIHNGIYSENILINKSISLTGENKENSIINGNGSENVITIRAEFVNITGFKIQNGQNSGILIENSKNCRVFRNVIDNNSIGIKIFSSNNSIISNNTIANNSAFGVYITNTKVPLNVSKYNTIFHNNLIGNKNNVFDEGEKNNWSYDKQGNFYDDYNGIDRNKDGIGDNSYEINGGESSDNFPLMMPFNGKIRIKKLFVDDESLYTMLIIGMIAVILFLIPIAYVWYRKTRNLK